MKKENYSIKFTIFAFLFAVAVLVSANNSFAQGFPNEKDSENSASRPNPTGDAVQPVAAAGYVSGLFSLAPGQTVRVSAVNMGKNAIPLQIVFVPVSEQGKAGISISCNATPAPGDAATEKFTITDGTSRKLMYVQIRVQRANDLKDIAPSLEVFSEQAGPNGGPHFYLGSGGFTEIHPIWVPS